MSRTRRTRQQFAQGAPDCILQQTHAQAMSLHPLLHRQARQNNYGNGANRSRSPSLS